MSEEIQSENGSQTKPDAGTAAQLASESADTQASPAAQPATPISAPAAKQGAQGASAQPQGAAQSAQPQSTHQPAQPQAAPQQAQAEEVPQQTYEPPQENTTNASFVQPHYEAPYASPKDHVAAGLLAIFLGGFGIHKFYLGYNTQGFIMLAITILAGIFTAGLASGVIWIIALIEGIIYLTKSQSDFEKIYVYGRREWF